MASQAVKFYSEGTRLSGDLFVPEGLRAGVLARAAGGAALTARPARPGPKALRQLAEPWQPWRGLAARLLWHYWRHLTGRPAMDDLLEEPAPLSGM